MAPDERDFVTTQFGVSAEQVQRDHLICHLLALLSRDFGDRIHFIGGTALARTHLPDGHRNLDEPSDLELVGRAGLEPATNGFGRPSLRAMPDAA
jgi:predicted nucleotidyltransferase component of viral defense system